MITPSIQAILATQSRRHEFDWGNLTWFADRSLGNSHELTVGRCILNPGRSNPRHYHPNCTEVLVVMKGRIQHTIDGDKEAVFNEGDTITVPPNVRHCATNIGDTEAVLIVCFSSADRQTIGEDA